MKKIIITVIGLVLFPVFAYSLPAFELTKDKNNWCDLNGYMMINTMGGFFLYLMFTMSNHIHTL